MNQTEQFVKTLDKASEVINRDAPLHRGLVAELQAIKNAFLAPVEAAASAKVASGTDQEPPKPAPSKPALKSTK